MAKGQPKSLRRIRFEGRKRLERSFRVRENGRHTQTFFSNISKVPGNTMRIYSHSLGKFHHFLHPTYPRDREQVKGVPSVPN